MYIHCGGARGRRSRRRRGLTPQRMVHLPFSTQGLFFISSGFKKGSSGMPSSIHFTNLRRGERRGGHRPPLKTRHPRRGTRGRGCAAARLGGNGRVRGKSCSGGSDAGMVGCTLLRWQRARAVPAREPPRAPGWFLDGGAKHEASLIKTFCPPHLRLPTCCWHGDGPCTVF